MEPGGRVEERGIHILLVDYTRLANYKKPFPIPLNTHMQAPVEKKKRLGNSTDADTKNLHLIHISP